MAAVTSLEALELDRARARRWLLLAAASLVLSGVLALTLVVGRMPGLDRLVGDPLFFKRALVVHVDLSLLCWFYAFVAGLFTLLPSRSSRGPLAGVAPGVSLVGIGLMVGAAAIPGVRPLLSNYVPMLDHPLFAAGLIVYAVGVALALLDGRLLAGGELEWGAVPLPAPARPGLRVAALALLVALLTFAASWLGTPSELSAEAYYEVLFWGGGHVLQFASVAAMVAVWLVLLTPVLGQPPVSRGVAAVLFGLLLLPVLAAPVLALHGPVTATYRLGFTRLMQWGIFPTVSLFLLLCLRALWRARREGRLHAGWANEGRVLGFFASAGLTVLGFVLGSLIRGSNTMVPAHYHASIGAVTAAFMAVTYVLLEPLGMPIPSPRLARLSAWQPLLFGVGQSVFAIGFGLAGAHGMGRKAYGAEQLSRSLPQTLGLWVMGLGGLVAVCGGLIFLWIVTTSWHRAPASAGPLERSNPWTTADRSIPSRS